eukprot:gene3681-6234_t
MIFQYFSFAVVTLFVQSAFSESQTSASQPHSVSASKDPFLSGAAGTTNLKRFMGKIGTLTNETSTTTTSQTHTQPSTTSASLENTFLMIIFSSLDSTRDCTVNQLLDEAFSYEIKKTGKCEYQERLDVSYILRDGDNQDAEINRSSPTAKLSLSICFNKNCLGNCKFNYTMFEGECAPYSGGKSLFLHAKKEEKSQFCVAATSKKDPAIVRFMGDCEADDSLPTVVNIGRPNGGCHLDREGGYVSMTQVSQKIVRYRADCDELCQKCTYPDQDIVLGRCVSDRFMLKRASDLKKSNEPTDTSKIFFEAFFQINDHNFLENFDKELIFEEPTIQPKPNVVHGGYAAIVAGALVGTIVFLGMVAIIYLKLRRRGNFREYSLIH